MALLRSISYPSRKTIVAQIFISYASSDRELTARVAHLLETNGHEVWWDTNLVSGDAYRSVIDEKLDDADVVIVIWTPTSVRSKWVIAEADHAERLGKLLPLNMDAIQAWQIPKPFGNFHTTPVTDESAVLKAVAHKANPDELVKHTAPTIPQVHDSAPRSFETSAENAIRGLIVGVGLAYVMLAAVVARRHLLGVLNLGEGALTRNFAVVGLAVAVVVVVVVACTVMSRRTNNPLYNVLLTSNGTNVAIHAALMSPVIAYGVRGFGEIDDTFFAGLVTFSIYAFLIVLQVRGVAFVYFAARILAVVQIIAYGLLLYSQSPWAGRGTGWWTTATWAQRGNNWWVVDTSEFLHFLYIATALSGIAIAVTFLVSSFVYGAKSPSS